MDEKKHEAKKKNTFDVETSIKAAVNVMFTQMQATRGFKLFGERAVAAMIKELKQSEEGSVYPDVVFCCPCVGYSVLL